jgi:MFS family permease
MGYVEQEPGRSVAVPFAAVVLAMLPAVLDQTILATALPTVAADLGRLTDLSWVVTAYVVAATATTPLWGQARRPARVQAAARGGPRDVRDGVGALRGRAGHHPARPRAGGPGRRRRRADDAGDGGRRRPRGAARARPLPGLHRRDVAVATVLGPLAGGLLVDHAGWRWVFYVNLPVGVAALAGLSRTLPAPPAGRPSTPLDVHGAALLAGATSALMLACVWGGDRYAWGSPPILALVAATVVLSAALLVRERRAPDPIVPFALLRRRAVAVASAGLFLTTAALFSVVVFVPLFLQTTTGASPTQAGLLLVPMTIATAISTTLSGRSIARTGRYKRFPIAGLASMTAALTLLAVTAGHPSRTVTAAGLAVFGLGFGLVTQILVVAVQNAVERRELGVATAATGFFRALGGAVGAAALGAVFAARAGAHMSQAGPGLRADVIGAVQTVFVVAAPLAALALAVVLWLPEVPLAQRTRGGG